MFSQSQAKIEAFIQRSGLQPRIDEQSHKSAYYFAVGDMSMKLCLEQSAPAAVLTSKVRQHSTLQDYQRFTWGVSNSMQGLSEAPVVLAFLDELFIDSSKKLPYQIDTEDGEHFLTIFDPVGKAHFTVELY